MADYTTNLAQARRAQGAQSTAGLEEGAQETSGEWGLLFFAAGFADLISVIPVFGSVVGPLAMVAITLWRVSKGESLINPTRFTSLFLASLVEFVFSALPTVLIHTAVCYIKRKQK